MAKYFVFNEWIHIRLTKDQKKDLKKVLKNNKNYKNISHIGRCALIKLIRSELGGQKDEARKIIRHQFKK